jgi:hypothetical protein
VAKARKIKRGVHFVEKNVIMPCYIKMGAQQSGLLFPNIFSSWSSVIFLYLLLLATHQGGMV